MHQSEEVWSWLNKNILKNLKFPFISKFKAAVHHWHTTNTMSALRIKKEKKKRKQCESQQQWNYGSRASKLIWPLKKKKPKNSTGTILHFMCTLQTKRIWFSNAGASVFKHEAEVFPLETKVFGDMSVHQQLFSVSLVGKLVFKTTTKTSLPSSL